MTTIPTLVGSPQMPVIAALPTTLGRTDYVCAVEHRQGSFGTVRAAWNTETGTWQAWSGHYDLTLPAALDDLIDRRRIQWRQSQE